MPATPFEDARDVGLRGQPDARVFADAQARQAILVTADKGFANTLTYPLGTHAGIIVVRIPDELPTRVLNEELLRTLESLRHDDLAGALAIVELGRVRIRRPTPRT
jgi:predicted nuclease of predicted toxin-antitoxin system